MTALSPATGQFVNGMYFGYNNHNGYHAVTGSPLVDGVFVMYPQTLPINSAGVPYTVLAGDFAGQSFDYIANNREVGTNNPLTLGGVVYSSGIGVHSSGGVTFNLAAINAYHATQVTTFSTVFGRQTGAGYTSFMRGYAVISNDDGIISDFVTPLSYDQATEIQLSIPANAKYLTLIAGAGGDGIGSDHGGFGNAVLIGVPEPTSLILVGIGVVGASASLWRRRRFEQEPAASPNGMHRTGP